MRICKDLDFFKRNHSQDQSRFHEVPSFYMLVLAKVTPFTDCETRRKLPGSTWGAVHERTDPDCRGDCCHPASVDRFEIADHLVVNILVIL